MITKGDNLGHAFPLLMVTWFVNMTLFLTVLWGGEFLIREHGYLWVIEPRTVTLVALGITKLALSIIILFSGFKRFCIDL